MVRRRRPRRRGLSARRWIIPTPAAAKLLDALEDSLLAPIRLQRMVPPAAPVVHMKSRYAISRDRIRLFVC